MKIDLIPAWVYWIVIACLGLAVGGQQLRVSGLQVDIATEKQSRSDENADRFRVAMQWQQYVDDKETAHTIAQQTKDNEYAKAYKKWEADRAIDTANANRLRGTIETFAAISRRPGESDAAFIERIGNRLKTIGGLLAGGADMVTESLGIIERRDLEVVRLAEQIKIDRSACSKSNSPPE